MKFFSVLGFSAFLLASATASASTVKELDEAAIALANAMTQCPAELADAMTGATRIAGGEYSAPRPANPDIRSETHTLTMVSESPDGIWSQVVATLSIRKVSDFTDPSAPPVVTYTCEVIR